MNIFLLSNFDYVFFVVKLAKARRGMIKDKGDKVGGNRNTIKEEIPDADAGKLIIFFFLNITFMHEYINVLR